MKTFLIVSADGGEVMGTRQLPDDAEPNTRAGASKNGKPFMLPVTNVFKDAVNAATHGHAAPRYVLREDDADIHFDAVVLSSEAIAERDAQQARQELLLSDRSMIRVIDDVCDLLTGEIEALPAVTLEKLAARKAARESL